MGKKNVLRLFIFAPSDVVSSHQAILVKLFLADGKPIYDRYSSARCVDPCIIRSSFSLSTSAVISHLLRSHQKDGRRDGSRRR